MFQNLIHGSKLFFSIWVFFHEHSLFTGQQVKEKGIFLIRLYHFHPLHRYLDISRVITAESSPLHIGSSRSRTGNLWFPSAIANLQVANHKSTITLMRGNMHDKLSNIKFLLQIQFFKNYWRRVSNRLRLLIIKPFHIMKIKINSFSLDLESNVK